MVFHILYNPLAGNDGGKERSRGVLKLLPAGAKAEFADITAIHDMKAYLASIPAGEKFIIAGGDGTLHHFVNSLRDEDMPAEVAFYPSGSGNDFVRDIGGDPLGINEIGRYLRHLPTAYIKDKALRFINGVGFGIDGYVCSEGNKLRANSKGSINYKGIAIKGFLYGFKPKKARAVVDGKVIERERIWMAPTMKGRYFGGGMMVTPGQDRSDPERKVTMMLFGGSGSLRTLTMLPSVYTGEHLRYTKYLEIIKANEVRVEFDKPCALQIDGETIEDVSGYSVRTGL